MDLLARREHGRAELSRKLCQRGAPEEWLGSVLDRLAEEGLLSEARYLEGFVRKRALAGYGPLRIREELVRQGVPRAEIEAALREREYDWLARLRELRQRKFGHALPGDARELAKQMRFLSYKGYPAELIGRVLKGLADE